MDKLDRIFNPRSVAVVGSKQIDNHNWLRTVLPFDGPKYHINIDKNEWPSAEELGFQNYERLVDVPGDIDFVIISVPAQVAQYVIADCVAKKVSGAHLYTAGYGEIGTVEGIEREEALIKLSREGGLNVVGPNCLGIFNPKIGIGVNLGGYHGDSGSLAFVSQSGSQSGGFARGCVANGIKISKLVSMGNGIILDSPDYLDYFKDDADTLAIGMYLEGVRDGKRFYNSLREVSASKPVMVLKVGESEDAARAVAAHSTSFTTGPAIWDAMLLQAGGIKVESIEEIFELSKLLLVLPPTTGDRLGLLALSGGHATEMTNVFSNAGFRIPSLEESSYERILQKFDVVGSTYQNPIEGRTLNDPEHLNNVLDVLNDDPNIDIIVHEVHVVVRDGDASLYRGHGPDLLVDFQSRARKPYVVAMSGSHPHPPADVADNFYRVLTEAGIPTLHGLQGTASALRKFVSYYQNRIA